MSRRDDYDNRRRRRSRNSNGSRGRRKSYDESRIEMITWFMLVLIFGVLYILPDETALPRWFVPGAGGVILLASAIIQYGRGWRVSPVTWLGGTFMIFLAYWGVTQAPNADLIGPSLITFAAVIGFGVVTGET